MMPHEILEGNPWEKGTKTRVKEWVKDNVRRRGLDSILWGRWEQCEEEEDGEEEGEKETVRKTGVERPKSRNPPTSRKQLRKLGESRRKICRVAEQQMAEDSNSEGGKSTPWPPPGAEGPDVTQLTYTSPQDGNKRRAARKRKEEYRKKRELKAQMKKEKVALKEKKRKELEDTLRKKGERLTKNQPKILEWFRRKEGGQRKAHTGGKKGVG